MLSIKLNKICHNVRKTHISYRRYFILRSNISLAIKANFIEKSTYNCKCLFLVEMRGIEPLTS